MMALSPPEGAACIYCDRPFGSDGSGSKQTRDHVVPRALKKYGEGESDLGRLNKVYACHRCNGIKANMLPKGLRKKARQIERDTEKLVALMRQIADRAEAIIKERGLL